MNDTTNSNVTAKNVGAKPRLSLLSSKQSCTRLNSEEYNPDQPELCSSLEEPLKSNGLIGMKTNFNDTNNNFSSSLATQFPTNASALNDHARSPAQFPESILTEASALKQALQDQSGAQHQRGFDKLSVSKEDLISLLSMLKSELQSKEVALASMKLEQLKRLMNPVEISRSTLAKTYIDLQDRLDAKEKAGNNKQNKLTLSASDRTAEEKPKQLNDSNQSDSNINDEETDQETIDILSTLLELLDRHPLLALPRDSIYCLDYNCDELSTKNYLNLKIQHLESLIDQHRKFRYHIRERLKRSEQRSLDLKLQLELERRSKIESERSAYKNGGKAILLGHIDQLKDDLEKEKSSKHAIVTTLLNELLDERERNGTLSDKVIELEKKLAAATRAQQQSTVAPVSHQQSISKPRVPVKPAQLLDRQLSSQSKNK